MTKLKKPLMAVTILTLITALAILLALGFAAPMTAQAETHTHGTALSSVASSTLNGGSYYLDTNITRNLVIQGNVTLCLNGNRLTSDGTSSVITVEGGATLTLCDCKGTGCIKGGKGKLKSNHYYGGGVFVDTNGTFIMNGGTISGNKADDFGGGVYVVGTFTMNGGEISGNTSTYGGGVSVAIGGQMTMTGGVISNNTSSQNGAGVYLQNCAFNISGTPKIIGNKQITSGVESNNNVYVGYSTVSVTGTLTEGAQIGVYDIDIIATGYTQDNKPSKFFIPDDPTKCVYVSNAADGDVKVTASHTAAAAVQENEVAATCTHVGSYDSVVYCSRCEAEISRSGITTPALGHDEESHEAKAATCTEVGWDTYVTCSRCDYTIKEEIPALGHNFAGGECTVCHIVAPLYWGIADGVLTLSSYQTAAANALYESYPPSWLSGAGSITSVTVDRYAYAPANMSQWFQGCTLLESANLSGLDTSRVTNMSFLFSGCAALTSVNVQGIDTSRVTNMSYVFQDCSSLTISTIGAASEGLVLSFNFSTESVTNMCGMFSGCSSIDMLLLQYYPNFTTDNVTDMCAMFNGCSGLTSLNVHTFDTSKVTDMSFMFSGCSKLTELDVSDFNTTEVTDMSSMFQNCSGLTSLNVSNFNTAQVTDMSFMFSGCNGLTELNVSNFNTTEVTDMNSMFQNCSGLTSLDLSSFDTTSVIGEDNVRNMMSGCSALNTIITPKAVGTALPLPCAFWNGTDDVEEITNDDASAAGEESVTLVRHAEHGFASDGWIDEIPATCTLNGTKGYQNCTICGKSCDADGNVIDNLTITATGHNYSEYWITDESDVNNHWHACTNVDADGNVCGEKSDVVEHTYEHGVCSVCNYQAKLYWGLNEESGVLTLSSYKTDLANTLYTDLEDAWDYSKYLITSVTVDRYAYAPKNISNWFSYCAELTSVNLTNLDTSRVTNMSVLFSASSSLETLVLSSSFTTAKVTNMGVMFNGCAKLATIDLSSFNTSNVENMGEMFSGCESLTSLDLQSFDTAQVVNMNNMFNGCKILTSLDLSNFNVVSVTWENNWAYGTKCFKDIFKDCDALHTIKTPQNIKTNIPLPCNFYNTASEEIISSITSADESTAGNEVILKRHAEHVEGTAATCKVLAVCSICNQAYGDYAPHTLTDVDGQPATCASTGVLAHEHCTVCGNDFIDGVEQSAQDLTIPALGHDEIPHAGKAATCTEIGWNAYVTCSRCDYTTYEELPATGHNYSADWTTDENKHWHVCTNVDADGNVCGEKSGEDFHDYVGGVCQTCQKTADLYWKLDGGVLTLSSYKPDETYQKYTNLFYAWKNDKANITSVTVDRYAYAPADMSQWFMSCAALETVDLHNLDTSRVQNMGYLFSGCSSLTSLDVTGFVTSEVTNMFAMFSGCKGLTQLNLSNFNTAKVTEMGSMFNGCSGLTSLDLSHFDTQKVQRMSFMFSGCSSLEMLNVSGFDTSSVTTMQNMFSSCQKLTSLNLSHFDTSNVTTMLGMFGLCQSLEYLNVSGFNTAKVTNMGNMFNECKELTSLDVSGFNTEKVTDMNSMFNSCRSLTSLDVSNFDTANVENMDNMFSNCRGLTSLDVSNFDTANVENMDNMFSNCRGLTSLNLSGFDTSNVTSDEDLIYMLDNCLALQEIQTPKAVGVAISLPVQFCNTASGNVIEFITSEDASAVGAEPVTLVRHEEHDWASEWTTDENRHWHACSICNEKGNLALHTYEHGECAVCDYEAKLYWGINGGVLTLSSYKTDLANTLYDGLVDAWYNHKADITSVTVDRYAYAPEDMHEWFLNCKALTSVEFTFLDTSRVKDMGYLFSGCSALTSLNVSNFNTEKVENMSYMFQGCNALTSLDLTGFVTSKVNNMLAMFSGCKGLTELNLSDFDTEKVTIMDNMFSNCSGLTSLDLSNFNTAKVQGMAYMFSGCESLTSLNLSNFNTAEVMNMCMMFSDCASLTVLDLSKFDVSSVVDSLGLNYKFQDIFAGCASLIEIKTPQNVSDAFPIPLPCAFWNGTADIDEIANADASTAAAPKTIYRHDLHSCDPEQWTAEIPATCTESGRKGYSFCLLCGEKCDADGNLLTDLTLPKLGHDIISHEGKATTCTEKGWNAYDTCSRCDYSTYEEIPATGHNISYRAENPATTDADGNTEHWECEECHKYFADPEGVTEITDKSSVVLPKLPAPAPARNYALWIALIVILSVVIAAEVAVITYREVRKKKAQKNSRYNET